MASVYIGGSGPSDREQLEFFYKLVIGIMRKQGITSIELTTVSSTYKRAGGQRSTNSNSNQEGK